MKNERLENRHRSDGRYKWGHDSDAPCLQVAQRLDGLDQKPHRPDCLNDSIPSEPDTDDENDGIPRAGEANSDTYKGTIEVQTFCGSSRLTPMCDQAVVENEANEWGKLWREHDKYLTIDWATSTLFHDWTPTLYAPPPSPSRWHGPRGRQHITQSRRQTVQRLHPCTG